LCGLGLAPDDQRGKSLADLAAEALYHRWFHAAQVGSEHHSRIHLTLHAAYEVLGVRLHLRLNVNWALQSGTVQRALHPW
jgi:hypothetical protein